MSDKGEEKKEWKKKEVDRLIESFSMPRITVKKRKAKNEGDPDEVDIIVRLPAAED